VVRIVIQDYKRAISFMGLPSLTPYLIAACCGNPHTVDEFLAHADLYQRGLAAQVVNGLIEADRTRMGHAAHRLASLAVEEVRADSAPLDLFPGPDGMVSIYLNQKLIIVRGRFADQLQRQGEIEITEKGRATGKRVTFLLPNTWQLGLGASSTEG